MQPFVTQVREPDPLADTWAELTATRDALKTDIQAFATETAARSSGWDDHVKAPDNAALHSARKALHDLAERCRDLTRQIDLAAKLAGRVADVAIKELDAKDSRGWPNTEINKGKKTLDTARAEAVEALRLARYFVRQADWLQERFPDAELVDVEGLVKRVDRAGVEAHDWSLTPGRYVGVAPEEEDEDFDFEETLRAIHVDLKDLNAEAAELAETIARNFEELGV